MTKIGKYKIKKKLGQGAMGEVWHGENPNLGIDVAIKTLAPKLAEDKTYLERFHREAKLAAKIRHNNVVQIYDADVDNDRHYIVMEYIGGGNLRQSLKKHKRLKQKQATEIILAIAQALKEAYKYKIVHRDIKPENIMISREGVPKLADLGIAKQIDNQVDITQDNAIIGTPLYMSPEQAKGDKVIDFSADIYSLGCTFFHLLTGKPPYEAPTPMNVLVQHINNPIPEAKSICPNLSDQVNRCVYKMMEKQKQHRHQSVDVLVENLQNCLAYLSNSAHIDQGNAPTVKLSGTMPGKKANKTVSATLAKRNTKRRAKPQQENKNYGFYIGLSVVCLLVGMFFAFSGKQNDSSDGESQVGEKDTTAKTSNRAKNNARSQQQISNSTRREITISDLGITMLPVSSGRFQMGSPTNETREIINNFYRPDETLHSVEITRPYWLSKYEVQYRAFRQFATAQNYQTIAEVEGGGSFYVAAQWNENRQGVNWQNINLSNSHPIVMVSYNDCLAFCRWLTNRERRNGNLPQGYIYSLPTEAQWEYACLAGSRGAFSGEAAVDNQAFYRDNSGQQLHPVGEKNPNAWGFYDMHGNVWEFCIDRSQGNDWFDVQTTTYVESVDPISQNGDRVVFRGGSWPDPAGWCRAAARGHGPVDYRCNNHGFRLALVPERE